MASLEHAVPISTNSVFYVASISKQFTAACVAILELEGAIYRDEDVRTYLPELRDFGTPIKIRHLIHHTGGLSDYFVLAGLPGNGPVNLPGDEDLLELLNRQPSLEFEPGTRYFYSNSGYVVLSMVVKRATGQSLEAFARDRIFSPLGMTRTSFNTDHTLVVRGRVSGYSPHADGGFRLNEDTIDLIGDAGVLSTCQDLYLWDQEFYERKLGDELIDKLLEPGQLDSGERVSYAYGLFIGKRAEMPAVWHGGGWAGFRAGFLRLPNERFSVILLSNHAGIDPTGLIHRITNLFVSSAEPRTSNAPVELKNDQLSRWAGHYEDVDKGMEFEITVDDGGLVFPLVPTQKIRLVPAGYNTFRTEGDGPLWELEFWESDDGVARMRVRATSFLMDLGRVWTAKHCEVVDAASLNLEQYKGEYLSDQIQSPWVISKGEGGLVVTALRKETKFRATLRDRFQSGTWVIDFVRDQAQEVIGLKLRASGTGDVVFSKV